MLSSNVVKFVAVQISSEHCEEKESVINENVLKDIFPDHKFMNKKNSTYIFSKMKHSDQLFFKLIEKDKTLFLQIMTSIDQSNYLDSGERQKIQEKAIVDLKSHGLKIFSLMHCANGIKETKVLSDDDLNSSEFESDGKIF